MRPVTEPAFEESEQFINVVFIYFIIVLHTKNDVFRKRSKSLDRFCNNDKNNYRNKLYSAYEVKRCLSGRQIKQIKF